MREERERQALDSIFFQYAVCRGFPVKEGVLWMDTVIAVDRPFKGAINCIVFDRRTSSTDIKGAIYQTSSATRDALFFFSFFSKMVSRRIFIKQPYGTLFKGPFRRDFFIRYDEIRHSGIVSTGHYCNVVRFITFKRPARAISYVVRGGLSNFRFHRLAMYAQTFNDVIIPVANRRMFSAQESHGKSGAITMRYVVR